MEWNGIFCEIGKSIDLFIGEENSVERRDKDRENCKQFEEK
jgi:hypothetical protein